MLEEDADSEVHVPGFSLFTAVILASVMAIAVLCYVWMKNSRASQNRMENHDRQIVSLLERQNEILLALSERLSNSEER